MNNNVTRFPRKIRPLTKTYSREEPYVVERIDEDDGSILYDVIDSRPETYRFICSFNDQDEANAKFYANQVARGLNTLVKLKMEELPTSAEND